MELPSFEEMLAEKDVTIRQTMATKIVYFMMRELLPEVDFSVIMYHEGCVGITSSEDEQGGIMAMLAGTLDILMKGAKGEDEGRCQSFTDPKEAVNFTKRMRALREKNDV